MNQTQDRESWRWSLPDSLDVPPDELKVRLDFYSESVVMSIVEDGKTITRMVSAGDVAMAMLRGVPLASGILPSSALWWSHSDGPEVALWRSPRVWPVALMVDALKPPLRLRLPMPGLIFVCRPGGSPRVYAARERPGCLENTLYHAPLFNLFPDGRSCAGTHRFPDNIDEVPESFFTSFFTIEASYGGRSLRYPDNLMALWRELDGKKRYPMSDLVPFGKVKDIMK